MCSRFLTTTQLCINMIVWWLRVLVLNWRFPRTTKQLFIAMSLQREGVKQNTNENLGLKIISKPTFINNSKLPNAHKPKISQPARDASPKKPLPNARLRVWFDNFDWSPEELNEKRFNSPSCLLICSRIQEQFEPIQKKRRAKKKKKFYSVCFGLRVRGKRSR